MYRHKYHDILGKRKEKKKSGFKSEKAVLKSLLEIKAALLSGGHNQVEKSNLKVSQWLDIWYETYKNGWEVTSRLQRKNAIKHQMKPLLGNYKLNALDKNTYVNQFHNCFFQKSKQLQNF